MIIITLKTQLECINHVVYRLGVPDLTRLRQVQHQLLEQIPVGQHDQIMMQVGTDHDRIDHHHDDYQNVHDLQEFVQKLENPETFNQRLNDHIRNNYYLKIPMNFK